MNGMSKQKRIIDNPSTAKLLDQIRAFKSLEALYHALPFARRIFPKFGDIFSSFSDIKQQAELLVIPDQFNDTFGASGWIAYESMNLEVMKEAVSRAESVGFEEAEKYLASSYDEDTIKWGIQRFKHNSEFRRRIRLAELAKEDYLAERYHACIPLLLSILDGLVNDVSKHVGFFADKTNMIAWDCIAGHESGLQTLATLMTKGRNKTNEEPITIPYRNGILHGRELAFDNRIVAAKSWAALFAALDWATAISDGKKTQKPQEKHGLREMLKQIAENGRRRKLIEEWKPRDKNEIEYLPYSGEPSDLPKGTPERVTAEFINNWCHRRYGLLADALLYFTDTPKGKKALMAKEDFGRNVPASFEVISVEDQAAAISHVIIELHFVTKSGKVTKKASVRAVHLDSQNKPTMRNETSGNWKIVQNSFTDILYTDSF